MIETPYFYDLNQGGNIVEWELGSDLTRDIPFCIDFATIGDNDDYVDCMFAAADSIQNLFEPDLIEKLGTSISSVADVSGTPPLRRSAEFYFSIVSPTVRYIYTLENRNDEPLSVTAEFASIENVNFNLTIVDTSSGDNIFGTDDYWIITNAEGTDRHILYFFGSPGFLQISEIQEFEMIAFSWSIDATLEFDKPMSFMFFAEITASLADAQAAISKFEQTSITPELLSGLTSKKLSYIQNFELQQADTNRFPPFSHSNLCAVSSEVRDRNSMRRGNNKFQFERQWFC